MMTARRHSPLHNNEPELIDYFVSPLGSANQSAPLEWLWGVGEPLRVTCENRCRFALHVAADEYKIASCCPPASLPAYLPSQPHLDLRLLACYVLAQPRTTERRHGTRRTRLLGGATVRILGQRSDDSRIQRAEGASLRKYTSLDPSVGKGTPG